jgi:phosphonate transport system permease protein
LAAARALPEVVLAIFAVALFGFGPFAGVVTLAIASAAFLAKLLADEMETLDPQPLDAIRSTGAGPFPVILFAVLPAVFPRFLGLTLYRLDINFRESAIIGIVGAGGLGATLNTAIDRYEFSSSAAILWLIIGIVAIAELASNQIRRHLA